MRIAARSSAPRVPVRCIVSVLQVSSAAFFSTTRLPSSAGLSAHTAPRRSPRPRPHAGCGRLQTARRPPPRAASSSCNLAGMNPKLGRQLGCRLLATACRQCYLRLECSAKTPSLPSHPTNLLIGHPTAGILYLIRCEFLGSIAIGITILFATPIYAYSESWIFDLNYQPPPPFLVNNAEIDTIDGHNFWRASARGIEGQVIYRFTLPPAEKTVSAFLALSYLVFTYSDNPKIQNLDSQAYLYVDVSKDALNWNNVGGFLSGHSKPRFKILWHCARYW